jgi:glycosyltransferase involved in cell wall biosynthesis
VRASERARTIQELAAAYPTVRLAGFQQEIRPFYAEADLQVVGSTAATGLRTRIVESFAYEVPVLSTRVGAEGVEGLAADENILLADDPAVFADRIRELLRQPGRLGSLAEAGRRTYERLYSRSAVASRLRELLEQHLPAAWQGPAVGALVTH